MRNINHLSWHDVQEALNMYFGMVGSTFVASIVTTSGWCVMRQLVGKFNLWTILFVPTLVGNAAVFLLPTKSATLFANTIIGPVSVLRVFIVNS